MLKSEGCLFCNDKFNRNNTVPGDGSLKMRHVLKNKRILYGSESEVHQGMGCYSWGFQHQISFDVVSIVPFFH